MQSFKSEWNCIVGVDSRQGGRSENQDNFACSDTPFGFLAIVCDGMGGGPAGSSASSLAVQAIMQSVIHAPQGLLPEVVLTNAVIKANSLLRHTIKEHPQLAGMGTTCVAVLLTPVLATIAHIGDSRLYHIRNKRLIFRTSDHSVVGEMVRKGELTEEDARRATNSNVLTRALGISDEIQPEIDKVQLQENDKLALCTDGIWGMISENQLVGQLSEEKRLEILVPQIMDGIEAIGKQQANANYDNLTLAIIQNLPKIKSNDEKTKQKKKNSSVITLFLLVLLVLSIMGNIYWYISTNIEIQKNREECIKGVENENVVPHTNDIDAQKDSLRLKIRYSEKKIEELKDTIEVLKQQPTFHQKETGEKQKLINKIISDVSSLKDTKGKNKEEVVRNKERQRLQILQNFKKLKDGNKKEGEDYNRIEQKIRSKDIIETDKKGNISPKANEVINSVVMSLKGSL